MLKYSRQRESIQEYLADCRNHPTAETIYEAIRQKYPNISLGTVYRNLSLLVSLGEITKITCTDGADRYDADTHPHYHFMCTRCNSVEDMPMTPIKSLDDLASNFYPGKIQGHQTLFFGICPHCLDPENNNQTIMKIKNNHETITQEKNGNETITKQENNHENA